MSTSIQRPHILLIDDNAAILDVMRDLFHDEGYRVSVAQAPLDAAAVVEIAPDVIVHDLLFGGRADAGWSALAMSQVDSALARIPRILCTAATEMVREPALAEHLDRLGVRVVTKPFRLEDLLSAVTDALSGETLVDQVRLIQAESPGRGDGSSQGGSLQSSARFA